jgi:hypothetical protein
MIERVCGVLLFPVPGDRPRPTAPVRGEIDSAACTAFTAASLQLGYSGTIAMVCIGRCSDRRPVET